MSEAKKYDRSYKEQSVKLALEIGVKRASEELKVPYGTLYGWVQAVKNGDLDIEERTPENAMSLAEEIRQLRSEVKRLNKEDESASCRRSRREARPLLRGRFGEGAASQQGVHSALTPSSALLISLSRVNARDFFWGYRTFFLSSLFFCRFFPNLIFRLL